MHPLLHETAHRAFPPPARPWVMSQRWHHLLFAHWALDPELVRPLLPVPLQPYLDVREGPPRRAWLGVIPFWMSGVKFRYLPPLPGISRFAELNVRTYVNVDSKPGVYFFSLDAESWLAVHGARIGYHVNYLHARMNLDFAGDTGETVEYRSCRRMPPLPGDFSATYHPLHEPAFQAAPGSLEHFLVERYCLYTVHRNKLLRGNIHHSPWTLKRASAEIETNSVASGFGIALPPKPDHLLFARGIDVLIWWPEVVLTRS